MTTKKTTHLIVATVISFILFSCTQDDNENNSEASSSDDTISTDDTSSDDDTGSGDDSTLEQFTPDQADWDTFSSKPFESTTNTSHDPDGIGWISEEKWEEAKWDGTIYNPSEMTKEEFYKALFPYPDVVRGLREVYYENNPFEDVNNPTKAEVDEWHRISINHIRALVGYTSEDRLVQKDRCMFARALWGDQRMHTTMWDESYPGEEGSAAGPCQDSSNPHCGASFLPDEADQADYLPSDFTACNIQGGAEGITSAPKSNIPWSIKWVRGLGSYLETEGFWGGHVGPWFHREKFGFNFWDSNVDDNDSNAILRAKWTGNLSTSLYEES